MDPTELIDLLMQIKAKEIPASEKPTEAIGLSFKDMDLSGLDLSGMDLSGSDFSSAKLQKCQLYNCNLTDTIFLEADISFSNFTGADLTNALMHHVEASNTGFGMATLNKVQAFQGNFKLATFSKATINNSDFKCSCFEGVRMREATVIQSDFTESTFRSADMAFVNVKHSVFKDADLRNTRLQGITNFAYANWTGTDIRNINFSGAYIMRRFVMDQNYLTEFKSKNKFTALIYYLWKISSNCGKSMSLWCFWIAVLITIFAKIYSFVGIDWGPHQTPYSELYFSVVTFTTLGFGDVVPNSTSGQMVAMAEVITGYIMLGGLLSILSNKIARRSD